MAASSLVRVRRLRNMRLHRFVGSQLLVQLASFAAGVLVIRSQSKGDYAIYAVIVSVLAAMAALTDSGLSNALLRSLSLATSELERAAARAAALRVRRLLSFVVNGVGVIFTVPLLLLLGARWPTVCVLCVLTVINLQLMINLAVRQVDLRFERRFNTVKNVTLIASIFRVAVIGGLAIARVGTVELLVAIGGVSTALEYLLIRRASALNWRTDVREGRRLAHTYGRVLRSTLPATAMSAAQYQGIYFVVGLRGGSGVVAELAAMSRFSVVFTLLNAVVTDVATRVVADRQGPAAKRIIFIVVGGYAAISAVVVGVAAAASTWILALLGPDYTGLGNQFVVVVAGAAVVNLTVAFQNLSQSAGYFAHVRIAFPLVIAWFILGLFVLDVGQLTAAAIWMALQFVPNFLAQLTPVIAGRERQLRAL